MLGFALLLLAAIIALRISLVGRQQTEQRVIARLRPVLLRATEEEIRELPLLSRAERVIVLRMWFQLHESLRGPALENLRAFALAYRFDALARQLLSSRNIHDQLLAIATVGLLRDKNIWDTVHRSAQNANPVISLTAARSLLSIDPERGLAQLLPDFARRADWPIAGIAAMLVDIGPDRITGPVNDAAIHCASDANTVQSAPRLLRLLELTHLGAATATARQILEHTGDAAVIAAALRLLRDPQDLPLLRRFCKHADWAVRVQAAHALGRIGTAPDRALLLGMIGDSNWWVRYRAAQALAALPFVNLAELNTLRQISADRMVADMLTQVIAEREAA